MTKTIPMLAAISMIALSATAAQAYDNTYPMPSKQQRVHDQEAYWQGHTQGSGMAQANPDYDFATTPAQRAAKRNAEYFAKIGYKGGEVRPFNPLTDVSEYPFPGSVPGRGGYVFSPSRK